MQSNQNRYQSPRKSKGTPELRRQTRPSMGNLIFPAGACFRGFERLRANFGGIRLQFQRRKNGPFLVGSNAGVRILTFLVGSNAGVRILTSNEAP